MVRPAQVSKHPHNHQRRDRAVPGSETLSRREATELLDTQARTHFHMSGSEFRTRYAAGHFTDSHDPKVIRVAALIPFSDD